MVPRLELSADFYKLFTLLLRIVSSICVGQLGEIFSWKKGPRAIPRKITLKWFPVALAHINLLLALGLGLPGTAGHMVNATWPT